ncbi:MAG: DUF4287 domain-containing protein [Actinomycetota bacterium]|nr:DUF4287 domain-containing protein [Actinomycetota bacterium]
MTRQKSFKERIRERMEKTGESYATARRRLIEKSQAEARKRRTPRSISPVRMSAESVRKATDHTWDEWFRLLDRWGAKDRKHGEIARWLSEEHGVDGWWAQSITVAYEQERGIRAPGQRADGTYSVSASKTVGVPVKRLFEAFQDEALRERWLGEFELNVRSARPPKSLTAEWEDASTRLSIGFYEKDAGKSQVALAHEKIADPQQADELKGFWRERMNLLKRLLEG